MNSYYPPGCDNRASNADPRSPYFTGHICKDCGESEYTCNCESREVREMEINALNEKIETLESRLCQFEQKE
mgnify:CR=1 FL=1